MSFRTMGTPPHGTVEIPVDVQGRPDTFGMKFFGAFSEATRRGILDFVAQATFLPAKRNGVPSAGVFTMTFR